MMTSGLCLSIMARFHQSSFAIVSKEDGDFIINILLKTFWVDRFKKIDGRFLVYFLGMN